MDLASLVAAQEQQRKASELKQQQEAAETLQKLSQVQVLPNVGASEEGSPRHGSEPLQALNEENKKTSDADSSFKMVMKNGVLMKKQKQRRYRTERPYSCQSCTARFTLRSNIGNMTVPHISPELKEHLHDMAEAEADAEKE